MIKKILVFLIVLPMLAAAACADELRYQAVWSAGTGSNLVSSPLSRAEFLVRGEELTAQGLRLIDVETEVVDGRRVYAGVWMSGTGANIFDGPMGPIQLRDARQARMAQGLRLVDVEIFRTGNGGRRYLGVWRPGSGEELVTGPMEEDAFLSRGQTLARSGMRIIDVEVERVGGRLVYTGLWRTGSGSNFMTTPLRLAAFTARRDQMRADGLELVDFERVRAGGLLRYVGVWASGEGESQLSTPRDFASFVAFGEDKTAQGFRTEDMEIFRVASPRPPVASPRPPGGGPDDGASVAGLPEPPRWIDFTHARRVVVDFTTIIENHPRITLPLDLLPDYLPLDEDGAKVIPDNFCGLRMIDADEVIWETARGAVETDFPYNRIESFNTPELEPFQLGGVDFTGPIGACEEANEPWQFFFPITQNSTGGPPPARRLTVELPTGSIEFLNFNIHAGEPLDARELFSDEAFETMKAIAEVFESLEIDNGYCSIDAYVQKVCEESPSACPVSESFVSPC